MTIPKRTALGWEVLEQELHAAGVSRKRSLPGCVGCWPRRGGELAKVIARYVEALGGRLDLVADFGDRTVRLPVSGTPTGAAA